MDPVSLPQLCEPSKTTFSVRMLNHRTESSKVQMIEMKFVNCDFAGPLKKEHYASICENQCSKTASNDLYGNRGPRHAVLESASHSRCRERVRPAAPRS